MAVGVEIMEPNMFGAPYLNQINELLQFSGDKETKKILFPKDEIFLGFRENLTLDEMIDMPSSELRRLSVTIPFVNEPIHVLASGMQASGKSYCIGGILFVDNIIRRFGFRGAIIDPSGEYNSLYKKVNNRKILTLWDKMGFVERRRELAMPCYAPLPCATDRKNEQAYQINIEKITIHDLLTLLDLHEQVDTKNARRRRLVAAIRRYHIEKDKGDKGVYPAIKTLCPPIEVIIENLRLGRLGGNDVLIEELENLKYDGLVGTMPPAPIVSSIAKGFCPIIHTTTDKSLSQKMAGIIQIEIEKIIKEREKDYNNLPSKLPFAVELLIDEYNVVASKKNFGFFKNIYDQMRKFGIGIVGIVPSLRDIHETVIKQSDYLICAKVMPNSKEEQEVKQRLNDIFDVTILTELDDQGKHIFPKEFALIDRNGDVRRFFPGFSISEHKKKRKFRRVVMEETPIEEKVEEVVVRGEDFEVEKKVDNGNVPKEEIVSEVVDEAGEVVDGIINRIEELSHSRGMGRKVYREIPETGERIWVREIYTKMGIEPSAVYREIYFLNARGLISRMKERGKVYVWRI